MVLLAKAAFNVIFSMFGPQCCLFVLGLSLLEGLKQKSPKCPRERTKDQLKMTNLEISAGITPIMSLHSTLPRSPQPDGSTRMTMSQLADARLQLDPAHQQQDISRILKGVVTNMHCLAKSSRAAGLVPYLDHAHNIYACYLKSQITSSSSPSDCNLQSVCRAVFSAEPQSQLIFAFLGFFFIVFVASLSFFH